MPEVPIDYPGIEFLSVLTGGGTIPGFSAVPVAGLLIFLLQLSRSNQTALKAAFIILAVGGTLNTLCSVFRRVNGAFQLASSYLSLRRWSACHALVCLVEATMHPARIIMGSSR